MSIEKPRITAKIAGRPLHPLLRPFAIAYFLAALACDLVYSQAPTREQECLHGCCIEPLGVINDHENGLPLRGS